VRFLSSGGVKGVEQFPASRRRGLTRAGLLTSIAAVSSIVVLPSSASASGKNRPPDARPDVAVITEDAVPDTVSGNVLTNDSDPNRDRLAVITTGTFKLRYGKISIQSNGVFTYTLDNTNAVVNALRTGQTKIDLAAYIVSDGRGGYAATLVTITIRGTTDNAPPNAVDDPTAVKEDATPNTTTGNVLTNDTDPDNDPLTLTNPGTFTLDHGQLTIQADGTYRYTLDNTNPTVNALNDGQTLTDHFTYTITDDKAATATATLTITIRGTTDN